ncbi:MAG: hypothetical protein OXG64_06430 [Chloroflexi bacterium]|nr:hypothetical protein [Chloroflexota bacterium]
MSAENALVHIGVDPDPTGHPVAFTFVSVDPVGGQVAVQSSSAMADFELFGR